MVCRQTPPVAAPVSFGPPSFDLANMNGIDSACGMFLKRLTALLPGGLPTRNLKVAEEVARDHKQWQFDAFRATTLRANVKRNASSKYSRIIMILPVPDASNAEDKRAAGKKGEGGEMLQQGPRPAITHAAVKRC
jgi:hypothetical protein